MAAKRKRKWKGTRKQRAALAKMLAANRKKRRGKRKRRRGGKRKASNPKRKRRRTRMAKKKRRGGRRRGGRGGMRIASGKDKAYIVAGSALYGYMSHHVDFFETLPVVKTIGAPLTHGILLHFAAGAASGELRKWLDLSSVGALAVGGYHLGITKGDLEAAAAMKGVEDEDDDRVNLRGHGDDVDYLEGDDDDFDDDDDDDDDVEGDDDDDDDDDYDVEGDGEIDDAYYEEAEAA